jgi:hypothetical protein
VKNLKLLTALFLATASFSVVGCGSKPDPVATEMGPAPTGPPAGSPYAAATAKPTISPDAFVAKLEGLPKTDRSAYLLENQPVVNAIMAQPEDSPTRVKLTAIMNQH